MTNSENVTSDSKAYPAIQWSVFQGNEWGAVQQTTMLTSNGVGLSLNNGVMNMMHEGGGSQDLWWTTFQNGAWLQDAVVPGNQSESGPALAEYNSKLYCVYVGTDWSLYSITNTPNTGTWDAATKFAAGQSAGWRPALAVFKDNLYCMTAWNRNLVCYRFDGSVWSKVDHQPVAQTTAAVALATYQGLLVCVHAGNADNKIWYTTFDGQAWSRDTCVTDSYGYWTGSGLAAAVFNGLLTITYRSPDSNNLRWATFDGNSWSAQHLFPADQAGSLPALCTSGDKLYCAYPVG